MPYLGRVVQKSGVSMPPPIEHATHSKIFAIVGTILQETSLSF